MVKIFLFQILFVVLRTINIQHVADNRLIASLISGTLLSAAFMYTMVMGVSAFSKNSYPEMAVFLFGGMIGIIIAMRNKQIIKFLNKAREGESPWS